MLRPSSTMISTGRCSVETIFPAFSRIEKLLVGNFFGLREVASPEEKRPADQGEGNCKGTRPRQFNWGSPLPESAAPSVASDFLQTTASSIPLTHPSANAKRRAGLLLCRSTM